MESKEKSDKTSKFYLPIVFWGEKERNTEKAFVNFFRRAFDGLVNFCVPKKFGKDFFEMVLLDRKTVLWYDIYMYKRG